MYMHCVWILLYVNLSCLVFSFYFAVSSHSKWTNCPYVGPLEGRRHDAFMLSVSGLLNELYPLNQPNGEPYVHVLYGDPVYGLIRNILSPFRGLHLTPLEKQDYE